MCDKLAIVSDKYLLLDKYRRNQLVSRTFQKPFEDTAPRLKLNPSGARACSSRARSIYFALENVHRTRRESRSCSFRIPDWRREYREIMYRAGNRCFCIFCSFLQRKTRATLNQYPHTTDMAGRAHSFTREQYTRSCRRTTAILPINNFLNTANSTVVPLRWDIIHCGDPRETDRQTERESCAE